MPNYYATLAETQARIASMNTTTVQCLMSCIQTASRRVDQLFASTRPFFQPYLETRKIKVQATTVNSYAQTLRLNTPLLSMSAVTVGTTALTANTDVVGFPDATMPPFYTIALSDTLVSNGYTWGYYAPYTTRHFNVSIAGLWGMSSDYGNSALSVDTLNGNITSSQTTMTVSDIDGENVYGISPRLSAGALVWLEDELVEVTDTNISTNVATIRRGVNGTTAASHLSGVAVRVFQVDDIIRNAVAQQAGLLFARLGSYNTTDAKEGVEIRYPADLMVQLRAVVEGYQYAY
jgi:hypothetical protein